MSADAIKLLSPESIKAMTYTSEVYHHAVDVEVRAEPGAPVELVCIAARACPFRVVCDVGHDLGAWNQVPAKGPIGWLPNQCNGYRSRWRLHEDFFPGETSASSRVKLGRELDIFRLPIINGLGDAVAQGSMRLSLVVREIKAGSALVRIMYNDARIGSITYKWDFRAHPNFKAGEDFNATIASEYNDKIKHTMRSDRCLYMTRS